MANIVTLNANIAEDVDSPQKMSVLTGEANTWLLIYSGIAKQRQRAEGSSGFLGIGSHTSTTDAEVNVTLDHISGVLLGSVTTASMSNILEENTWGQWIIQSTSLTLRDNGDLVLTARTEVTGEGDAEFWSFYYHVSAKVVLDEATISGTIRWPITLAQPLGSPRFTITANTIVRRPPIPGQFPIDDVHVEASGTEGALEDAGDVYRIPYTIRGPLLGKPLTVLVTPLPARFSGAPTFGQLIAAQVSGPNPINLTSVNRHATNVDFEMRHLAGPR